MGLKGKITSNFQGDDVSAAAPSHRVADRLCQCVNLLVSIC